MSVSSGGTMMNETALRRALAEAPGAGEGWRRLAHARFAADPSAACAGFARALALSPAAADWNNLAEALRVTGRAGAASAVRRALALDPALPEAHNTSGTLLLQLHVEDRLVEDRLEERAAEEKEKKGKAPGAAVRAAGLFARALALRADFPRAAYNQAAALAESGALARAIDLYLALLGRHPGFLEARWNLALALLASGRWRQGWQAHESRRADPRLAPRVFVAASGDPVPSWDGSPPAGRRILLASEQGFGDTIQFLRYVPQVIALGARVTLDVPPALRRLVAQSFVGRSFAGLDRLVATGEPIPAVDLEAPLMSLPFLLGPERPPPTAPYLTADPGLRAIWRRKLAGPAGVAAGGPRIGIVWAGNPDQPNDRRRSIADADLAPLIALGDQGGGGQGGGGQGSGLRFVSLQKGRALPAACRAVGWIDAGPDLADFAETAALIAELDLVIAVDTAVAHLAGALGRPVWVLLSGAADWRWPRGQGYSPWYPGARQVWRRQEGGQQEGGQQEPWRETLARLAGHLAAAPFDPHGDPDDPDRGSCDGATPA